MVGLSWRKVARLTGLEPATPGVTGRYSNQLSYNRASRFGVDALAMETASIVPGGRRQAPITIKNACEARMSDETENAQFQWLDQ